MTKPPVRRDEAARIASLEDYAILDTLPEEVYDRIVGLAAGVCDTPIALFSLVDAERQWFKARLGLEAQETPRELSFCAHAVATDEELLVDDAAKDPRFVDNMLVLSAPNIRFYYGVPIHSREGYPLGTLCVIDRQPRRLETTQRDTLSTLAREIEAQLELRRASRALDRLLDERAVMSSMIAHDARNLMVRMVADLDLLRWRVSGEDADVISQAQDSMQQLLRMCDNFVKLNQARGAPSLRAQPQRTDLVRWFEALVRRERRRARARSIELESHLRLAPGEREIDADLLERLVLNLLDNAYREAPEGSAVQVELEGIGARGLRLSVEDRGRGVPESARERLFEPFFSASPDDRSSSGLGLAFCRLAAEALGGRVVHETPREGGSRFRLEIPDA